jgi:hypothetical protein
MMRGESERLEFWNDIAETLERADALLGTGDWQEAARLLAGITRVFSEGGGADSAGRLRFRDRSRLPSDERERAATLLTRTREVLLKCIGLRDCTLAELEALRRQGRYAGGFRDSPDAAWLSEQV